MLKLVCKPASEYWLAEKNFAIGSAEDNHLALIEAAVDPHHARITYDGKRYCLRDLNSSEGTYVNNQRIVERPLTSGDEIRIGSTTLDVVDPMTSTEQDGWCLVPSASWLQGSSFKLPFSDTKKTIKIGRAEHCDVIFPETHLAREHLELTLQGDHLAVKNLKASNNTFINDKPAEEGKLTPGDTLRLEVYNFKVVGPVAKPEIVPPIVPDLDLMEFDEPEKRWKTRPTSPGNREEEEPKKPSGTDNLALKIGAAVAFAGLLLLGVYLLNT